MVKEKSNQRVLIISLISLIILLAGALIFTQIGGGVNFITRIFEKDKIVTLPPGLKLNVSLSSSLSSGINRIGDVIQGTITTPVLIGENIVVPIGSNIIGAVSSVQPAEQFKAGKGGFISIRFTKIQTPNGKTYSIDTQPLGFSGAAGSRLAKGVTKTVIGAATGAALGTAIGAIAGGKRGVGRGAWSGAAIGGGLGAASAIVSKGQEAYLGTGSQLLVTLSQPVDVIAEKN